MNRLYLLLLTLTFFTSSCKEECESLVINYDFYEGAADSFPYDGTETLIFMRLDSNEKIIDTLYLTCEEGEVERYKPVTYHWGLGDCPPDEYAMEKYTTFGYSNSHKLYFGIEASQKTTIANISISDVLQISELLWNKESDIPGKPEEYFCDIGDTTIKGKLYTNVKKIGARIGGKNCGSYHTTYYTYNGFVYLSYSDGIIMAKSDKGTWVLLDKQ